MNKRTAERRGVRSGVCYESHRRTLAMVSRGGSPTERVAIIIPTLNEASSIGQVLDSIPADRLREDGYEPRVYVIDGRSTDGTREIAAQKGASLILETRKGKGRALRTAFQSIDADYVVISDGDGTYPLERVGEIVTLLKTYDVVMGSRRMGTIEPQAMTKLNSLGNNLLTLLANVLFHSSVSDMCTGLWGFTYAALNKLELAADGFDVEADMYTECVLKGLRLTELPIYYRARSDPAKLSAVRDGVKIGAFLCKKWWSLRTSAALSPSNGEPADQQHVHDETGAEQGRATADYEKERAPEDVYQAGAPQDLAVHHKR